MRQPTSRLPETDEHLREGRKARPEDFYKGAGVWLKPRCLACEAPMDCANILISDTDTPVPVITTICTECLKMTTALWSRETNHPTMTTRLSPEKPVDHWYQQGISGRVSFALWSRAQKRRKASPPTDGKATERLMAILKDESGKR